MWYLYGTGIANTDCLKHNPQKTILILGPECLKVLFLLQKESQGETRISYGCLGSGNNERLKHLEALIPIFLTSSRKITLLVRPFARLFTFLQCCQSRSINRTTLNRPSTYKVIQSWCDQTRTCGVDIPPLLFVYLPVIQTWRVRSQLRAAIYCKWP